MAGLFSESPEYTRGGTQWKGFSSFLFANRLKYAQGTRRARLRGSADLSPAHGNVRNRLSLRRPHHTLRIRTAGRAGCAAGEPARVFAAGLHRCPGSPRRTRVQHHYPPESVTQTNSPHSEQPSPASACRLGIAFGGGLPFGLVALGVLRAFEEEHIRVHRLAGTSMGSIIAATYAAGLGIDECVERFRYAFNRQRMLAALLRDLSFSGQGLLRGKEVVHMLESFLGRDVTFEDLKVPLRVPACDLADGTEVVFDSGPLIPAIRASISLPGIFAPFHYEDHQLVDGALIRPIPVHLLGDDEVDLKVPVRAVRSRTPRQLHDDIHRTRDEHRRRSLFRPRGEDIFSVVWRTMSLIMQDEFAEMIFDDFDVYIKPRLDLELSRDPSRIDEIVQAGYDETRRTLPRLREAMDAAAENHRRPRESGAGRDPLAHDIEKEIEE